MSAGLSPILSPYSTWMRRQGARLVRLWGRQIDHLAPYDLHLRNALRLANLECN